MRKFQDGNEVAGDRLKVTVRTDQRGNGIDPCNL